MFDPDLAVAEGLIAESTYRMGLVPHGSFFLHFSK